MGVYAGYDLNLIADPRIRALFELIFDITSGHDHDGTNTKAVTTGTPAAGALAATAGGRAIIASDYFDAATVLAKFAADSIDNAQLLKAVKNGAFVADAATRALFADGLFTAAKLADTADIRNTIRRGQKYIHMALRRFRQGALFSTLTLIFVRQRTSAHDSRLQAFFQCRCSSNQLGSYTPPQHPCG